MKTQPLSIDLLHTDSGTQSRAAINEEVVQDYAELVSESNGKWPFNEPVDVFHDGSRYYVSDGFHRVFASTKAKRASVPCRVHKGTAYDALLFGMKANTKHGLRRSNEDKRHSVSLLLDDDKHYTQKEVAEAAGVSVSLVKTVVASRKPDSLRGHASPPQNNSCENPSTPSSGDSEFPVADEFLDGTYECPPDSIPFGEEPETEEPPEPAPKPKGKPPKQYERSALLKQWGQMMGPMVRWVDKAADSLGEKHSQWHTTVQEHLNHATDEMMEAMGE